MADQKAFDPVPTSLALVIGKEVSRGSFGVVFFATLNENPVAVKEFHEILMKNTSKNVHFQNFRKECEQLKELAHTNIVKFIGAYQGAKGPLLVMELMHETLEVYLEREKGKLSRERVLEICFSVCEGMAYLHGLKNPLIHRDLSSKNVLLTETGVVKIADFGQSKLLGDLRDTLRTTQPGTISYMPPEALEKKKRYTAKVDSFSLGVLMLEICTQSPPSSGLDGINYEIEVKRREDDLRLLDDAHPLKPLIVWCLQYEELRPTVTRIFNHVNICKASNNLKTIATVGKDTSETAVSSQPKGPSLQPSVTTKNAGLRDKVASLETELQESNDKVRDLEANLERLATEKEDALKATNLESELQKSNDKVKDLEANLERLAREKEDALKKERESTKIDKAALQNLVKTLQQDKDELEGKFDAAKKEAEKGQEDKKELKTELERMENELEKLRRNKYQEKKYFEDLLQTLEQTKVKMGELNDQCEKVHKDRREIAAERNKLEGEKERLEVLLKREKAECKKSEMLVKEVKDVREQLEKEKIEKMKHMEELENAKKELEKFYKERQQQQAVDLLQKPSGEADEDAFHSFESNSPKSSPKIPRFDAIEEYKRMHQQAVKESIEALKNRDHGNLEDYVLDSWEDISKEAGFDHELCKTTGTEEKLKEVIAQLKEQLSKQSNEARKQQEAIARLKDNLERDGKEKEAFKHIILKEAESDKQTVFVENGILKRQILELESTISEKGLLIEQLQTQQSKSSDLLQPTAPDAQPHSLREMSTRGKVPTVKRQQSYEASVSVQVSPPELTESALHSSLERQSGQQHTQTQIEEQATPVKQDFTVATIVDLHKQLKASRKEVERLQQEKDMLRRDLEDATRTIDNLQERDKLEQPANLLQKPSSEADEDAFHSFESSSPKSSPKVPRSDALEQLKRIHQQSVQESVEALKSKDHGNLEDSAMESWVYVPKETSIDYKQCKTTDAEKKLEEVVDELKEQLSKESDNVRRQQKEIAKLRDKLDEEAEEKKAFKLKILKEAENDKGTVSAENENLNRQIHDLKVTISQQGAQIEQLRTQQSKPSDHLQPTAPDAQPHSLGEVTKRGKVPTVKRQQSYEASVSVQVSPPELTESALHSSLERQSGQQHPQTQIEEQATPVKQDFTVATIVDLRKQLKASRKEVERLQREKDMLEASQEKEPNSEIETLRRDLEDARKTIDNLQDDLMKAMEKYTRVMAEVKALHEENKKRLRDTTNRQDSVRKQEVISKLEGKVEDLEEEVEARKQHEQKLMEQIKRGEEEKKYLEDVVAQVKKKVEELQEEIDARMQHEQKLIGQIKRGEEEKKYLEDIGAQLKKRAEDADKSREGLEDENITFKQIINQFQSDFNQERKDRQGEAGRFADQEKQWMEQIRQTNEERDHLKALTTQLRDERVALKHEVEWVKRESHGIVNGLDQKLAFQENTIKEQEAANRKQEAEHKKWEAALQKRIERLNQEVSKLKADLADKHKERQGAKALGDAYQRLHGEKVGIENQLNTAMETHKISTQHIRELEQENQHLKASNENARRREVQTTGEIQSLQEQYRVLSIQFAKMRDENQRLRSRSASQTQYDEPRPPYGQTHPVYGDNQKTQQEQSVVQTAQTYSPESDLTEKNRPPNSTQPVRKYVYLPQPLQVDHQHVARIHYSPIHTVPGTEAGRGLFALGDQLRRTAPPTSLPRSHSTPDRQDSDRSSDSVLPSPMNRPPPLESLSPQPPISADHGYGDKRIDADMQLQSISSGPYSSLQADKRYIRDRINFEIEHEAKKYKEGQQKGVPVADDEKLRPYDPNLVCPHCGQRFRHGQIREFRYHIDDEHPPP